MRNTTDAVRRVVDEAEELAGIVEREAEEAGRLVAIAGLLPALDEASISIGILADHLLLVRNRLDAVRRKLHEAAGSKSGSTPPPPPEDG